MCPCQGTDSAPRPGDRYGYYGGETKQDLFDALSGLLGIPRQRLSVGSSLPAEVFQVVAARAEIPAGSMPEIGRVVAQQARLAWTTDCDSTASVSGGGSTVTATGLRVLLDAVGRLG